MGLLTRYSNLWLNLLLQSLLTVPLDQIALRSKTSTHPAVPGYMQSHVLPLIYSLRLHQLDLKCCFELVETLFDDEIGVLAHLRRSCAAGQSRSKFLDVQSAHRVWDWRLVVISTILTKSIKFHTSIGIGCARYAELVCVSISQPYMALLNLKSSSTAWSKAYWRIVCRISRGRSGNNMIKALQTWELARNCISHR